MLNKQAKNIVLVDDENKNYTYVTQAIANITKTHSNLNFQSFHFKHENHLSEIDADIVYICTDWILKYSTDWFYHFFDKNNQVKFVILINHSQGNYIKKLLNILNSLPLESNIIFIPIDNYSPSIIVQCMMNDIITFN